ncbi:MAG: response regulator, partial [Litorivicinus sp.]
MDILLIEDHAVVAEGIKTSVGEPFQVCHWARDGESGLAWLQSHRARIAIVDLKMPGIGGVETIRRLRRHFPQVAIVVFSSV